MTRLRSTTLVAALLVAALAPAGAQAASLTTTFAGGNGCFGNMFDVTSTVPIEITSFDQNVWTTTPQTVDVYYKVGTYVGSETNAGAWTLLGSVQVTGVGDNLPTPVPIGGLAIPKDTTYGIYIDLPEQGNNYTDGNNVYSNGTVTVTTGAGLCATFGSVIASRTWNGTIYYEEEALVSVLEIPTLGQLGLLALTLGLGAAGVSRLRRRRT